jgi:hypothetical protein
MKFLLYNELGVKNPIKISEKQAIDRAKSIYPELSDREALDEFIVVNWAWYEPENR